ncbi:MAG TPA: S1/P1 nuclease [Vicinamibacterales bacterium]|nr:S1/P1 nuclease [Vicinamibacterales bacterium]
MTTLDGKLLRAAVAAALLSTFAASVGAFGDAGHRIVGTIAALHLKDTRALTETRKNETLAEASVWPDRIKDPLYEDGDTPMFRLNHPAHDTYHFANLPFQAERYSLEIGGSRTSDIVQMTKESIRVLRSGGRPKPASRLTQRDALRLLAHFVGDLHQPLHIGNAFIPADGPLHFFIPARPDGWRSTLGGNALIYGPEGRFNLHAYWDSHAVNITMQAQDVSAFAARLAADVKPAPGWTGKGDVEMWPDEWATESLALAKGAHRGITLLSYKGPDDAKRVAHRWSIAQSQDYDDRARPIVRQQLAAGGYRLSAVLKAIWP